MFDLRAKRDLNNGFGEALSRAVELALTPAIFAVIGWRIDLALGTSPLFLVALFLLVISYVTWKLFMGYDAEMRRREDELLHRHPRSRP